MTNTWNRIGSVYEISHTMTHYNEASPETEHIDMTNTNFFSKVTFGSSAI